MATNTNPEKPVSTGMKSSEAKVLGGLSLTALATLAFDFWSENAEIFDTVERRIVLGGIFVLAAAYIVSRGLKVNENRPS